jgi:murein L,D-transpeptidase YcbB/YkuD
MSAWSSRPICWIWAALSIARPDVAAAQSPSLTDSTRERLGALVGSETPALQAFYARQGLRPVWSGDAGALPRAFELQRLLSEADQDGLLPDDYALPPLRPALDPDSLAAFDVALSRAALHYAADLASGRVDPAAVESVWTAAPREIDIAAVLDTLLAADRLPALRGTLAPPPPGYARLCAALARYRAIAARGGWAALPGDTLITPADSGPAAAALRARLVAEGDLVGAHDTATRYDVALSAAVRRFQRRHGLAPDGAVGPATLAQLNVPVEHRIRQMELNLERWRWLPRALGERYVMVNSAALDLEVVQHDSVVLRMRAVVGRLDWPTPIVSSRITGLQFAPAWSIPRSIAVQEILPLVRRDTTYLRRHRIRVLSDSTRGVEIDPATVDWSRVTDSTFAFQLRQEPGGTNPLGGVKFFFPNRFSSFIHDTPFRTAFREPVRTASHGCVRVEGAVDLAVYLLDNPARWPRDSIRRAMKRPEGRWVALRRPIPVHLGYWTAWVAQDGTVEFRDDFYGWDSALERALAAR